jgi:hypothetical protein
VPGIVHHGIARADLSRNVVRITDPAQIEALSGVAATTKILLVAHVLIDWAPDDRQPAMLRLVQEPPNTSCALRPVLAAAGGQTLEVSQTGVEELLLWVPDGVRPQEGET